MLFSTNSATAFSGLACELAMILIAFQWLAIRSFPAWVLFFCLFGADMAITSLQVLGLTFSLQAKLA
jgi:hypothetical protein